MVICMGPCRTRIWSGVADFHIVVAAREWQRKRLSWIGIQMDDGMDGVDGWMNGWMGMEARQRQKDPQGGCE